MPFLIILHQNLHSVSENTLHQIVQLGKSAIQSELNSLKNLPSFINEDFAHCINEILQSQARVIITGIGKSAIIAQKIVATMNSTGQPALFMHAADAIHGDLGMIQKNDTVIVISKSGNTPEIKSLIPLIKQFGNTIIAIVGNTDSFLAKNSKYTLNTTIDREACPNNLAPTTSTTAQLLMGDALSIALLEMRNFSANDFSKFHPGGALGKQLYLQCEHIALNNPKPSVKSNTPWKDVIFNITQNRLGATAVVNDENTIIGIVTDGDVRRMLENNNDLTNLHAEQIMSPSPTTLDAETMAIEAAQIMQTKKITQIPITKNKLYFGFVHLHDLYREGIL